MEKSFKCYNKLVTVKRGAVTYEDRHHIGQNVVITYTGDVLIQNDAVLFKESNIVIDIRDRLYCVWESVSLQSITLAELKELVKRDLKNSRKISRNGKI